MTIHLFAFGGTGASVLYSLTMLLASGATIPPNCVINPIILDVDTEDGNAERTRKAIELYRIIRENSYRGAKEEEYSFFNAEILPLQRNVMSELVDNSKSFLDFLDYHSLDIDGIDSDLLKLLYNDSDNQTVAELKLNLSVGFKGNPNIGAVVFNSLGNTSFFTDFCNSVQDSDRIFIISSNFGGNGSSGFPQLVKLLESGGINNGLVIKSVKKGALTVLPYFGVKEKEDSAIKSTFFYSKAKAALSYYGSNLSLNATYYITDTISGEAYENIEGGQKKINKSHLVELYGASAILDFINKKDNLLDIPNGQKSNHFEFILKNDNDPRKFCDFYLNDFVSYIEPIIKFAYASKVYLKYVREESIEDKAGFISKEGLNIKEDLNTDFYTKLHEFMNDYFIKNWIDELKLNKRSFDVFDFDSKGYNHFIKEKTIKTAWIGEKGINKNFLESKFNQYDNADKTNITDNKKRFLKCLSLVAQDCYDKLGEIPQTGTSLA